jgi:ribonuclease HII
MPRATRVGELLAFDLSLSVRQPGARPRGVPSLFSSAARGESHVRCSLAGFDEAGRGALAGPVVVGCVQLPWELLAEPDRIAEALGGVDDSKRLTARAREAAFAGVVSCARWAVGCASAGEIDAVGIVEAARRAACRAYRWLGVVADLAVFDRGLSLGVPVPLDLEVLQEPGTRQQGSLDPEEFGGRVSRPNSQAARQQGSPDPEEFGGRVSRPNSQATRQQGPPDPEEFGGRVSRPNSQATRQQGSPDPEEFGGRMFRPNSQATRQQGSPSRHPPGVAFTKGDMRSLHVAAASIVAKVTRDHLMERLDAAFPGFELSRHKGYGTEEHRRAISRLGPSPIHRRTFLHFNEEAQSQSC